MNAAVAVVGAGLLVALLLVAVALLRSRGKGGDQAPEQVTPSVPAQASDAPVRAQLEADPFGRTPTGSDAPTSLQPAEPEPFDASQLVDPGPGPDIALETPVDPPADAPGATPACAAPAAAAAPETPADSLAAPVELWMGELCVGVKQGSQTQRTFQRYADSLLAALKEAKGETR